MQTHRGEARGSKEPERAVTAGPRRCGTRRAPGSRLGGGPTAPLPSLGRTARNEERRVPPPRCKRHRERVP